MRAALGLVLLVTACGDDAKVAPDAGPQPACSPDQAPLAMVEGPFDDAYALPLEGCAEGGLEQLPGRWFVRDPERLFDFLYPRFEGSCATGFRRSFYRAEAPNAQNGRFQTWSDGTRFLYRNYYTFSTPEGTYEYATAFGACLRADGSMSAVLAEFDTDRGERIRPVTAEVFEPKDEPAKGLSLVGQFGDASAFNVALDGNHAYIVGPTGFDVIDISTPAAPTRTGHIDGQFNDVKFHRTANRVIAYAAPLNEEGTTMIDVTNPAQPMVIGIIDAYSHSIFITPDTTPPRMYLANYSESVPVYDITNPAVPVLSASVPIRGTGPQAGIHDIHVVGSRIYADKTIDGVVAVDVAAGFNQPTELGRILTSYSHATWEGTVAGKRIAIHGDEGMTLTDGGSFLRVIDADDQSPTFMEEIGRYQSRANVGIHNMMIVGDRAYIAYYQDGIRVIDLTTPTAPVEVAHYNTYDNATAPGGAFEGALGLAVRDGLVYVADSQRGLVILSIDGSR